MASFWYWGRKPVARAVLEALLGRTQERVSHAQAEADKAARQLERARRPDLIRKAERKGRSMERQLNDLAAEERRLYEALGSGDERKRKKNPPPPPPPGKRWRYHPRVSYVSSKKSHNAVVEVYFQRRDGARMTEAEVVLAMEDIIAKRPRRDLKLGAVMYGQKSPARRLQRNNERSNFIGIVFSGTVDDIGEDGPR